MINFDYIRHPGGVYESPAGRLSIGGGPMQIAGDPLSSITIERIITPRNPCEPTLSDEILDLDGRAAVGEFVPCLPPGSIEMLQRLQGDVQQLPSGDWQVTHRFRLIPIGETPTPSPQSLTETTEGTER